MAAAVGRGSVPIPDADLLRDTDSVCGDSGVPAPQTRDLSNITSLGLMPLLQVAVGLTVECTAKEQTDRRVATAQVGEPRGWGALLEAGLLCPRWPGVTSLPS